MIILCANLPKMGSLASYGPNMRYLDNTHKQQNQNKSKL